MIPTSGVITLQPKLSAGTEVTPADELRKVLCHKGAALAPVLLSASNA